MGALRALLIAVPSDLGFTAGDAARVKDALLASGCADDDLTVLDTPERTSRTRLYAALRTFLAGLRDEDAALVYFSGHGVRVDDVDHLVPHGYDPAAGPAELVAVRPDELLGGLTSQATVLVCLDACRDALTPDPGQVTRPDFTGLRENVVLLYGCPPGRQAMGNASGSFMGRALAEALGPGTPPRTVGEVIAAVRRRTREIAADNGQSARLDAWWLHGRTGAPAAVHADRVICASGPGRGLWAEAVRGSALWDRVAPGTVGTGPLADGLGRIVEKVAAIRRDAAHPAKAGPDPWDDPHHPARVLCQLDRLVPPAAEGGRLSALEAVTLLATPFVREAAVACGRRALARLHPPQGPRGGQDEDSGPDSGTRSGSDSGSPDVARRHLADDMADVRRAFGQIEAKRLRLLAAGDAADTAGNVAAAAEARDAAVAAESWLRHRLLAGWDQLWDQLAEHLRAPGTGGPVLGELDSLTAVMELLTDTAAKAAGLGANPPAHSRDRLRAALFQVVAQMRTRPGPDAPNDELWQTGLAAQLGIYAQPAFWRPARLAELLYVAELLAVDPRLLDGIVVDHLGVPHHRVTAADVVAQVVACDVHPVDAGHSADWTLSAACHSAALHVALERQADSASSAARNIAKAQPSEILLSALPRHINTDALEPVNPGSYEAPPPRFQLAEDGVKPLIMGTQLYGDRLLAIRELYQNALDACRRRQARQQYAARTGDGTRRPAELASYTVTFALARDPADGRLYVECQDEGIGMTAEELRDLFARAGRRNEQSPARVRELRRWRRVGIVPELNSRFGIGVFSYFMLAEEIRVTTRPAARSGFGAGPSGHRVDVVADSGLMHITPCDDIDAGTTVRLYLRPEFADDPPSVGGFLREHVWYSPVALLVTEETTPGSPVSVPLPAGELLGAMPPLVTRQDPDRDIWWTQDRGLLLVDGIAVSGARTPFGYIVNLRHRHRPVLSASRNQLNAFDEDMVMRELVSAADDLTRTDALPLGWLWELVDDNPALGVRVVDRLLAADTTVSISDPNRNPEGTAVRLWRLGDVGCIPLDTDSSGRWISRSSTTAGFFHRWRSGIVTDDAPWDPNGTSGDWVPSGFPRPRALDAVLFREPGGHHDWDAGAAALQAALDTGADLRTLLRALRRYAVTGVVVPAPEDLSALRDVPCTSETKSLHEAVASLDSAPEPAAPVLFAGRTRRTLGHVADLTRLLRILDPRIPEPPDIGDLTHHVPTPAETRILGGVRDAPALPLVVTPAVAAFFANRLGYPVAQVIETARRYRPFGYQVTGEGHEQALLQSEDARTLYSARMPTPIPRTLPVVPVTLHRLLLIATVNSDVPVAETLARVREAASRTGLHVDVDDRRVESVLAVTPGQWWQALLLQGDPLPRAYSVLAVLRALSSASPYDAPYESPADEVRRTAALAAAGIVDPNATAAVRRWLALPPDQRPAKLLLNYWHLSDRRGNSSNFSLDFDPCSNTLGGAYLITLAAHSHTDLGAAADEVRDEAASFGIGILEVPAECRALRPDLAVHQALCDENTADWKHGISLRDVLRHADARNLELPAAAEELRAYEPFGAPAVPRHDPSAWTPDPAVEELFDYAPLDESLLTPLALVVTAVRLDRGLASTYRALTPYGPYGLDMSACPEPADDAHAPDWRDVVLLSRKLTGTEPALGGEVTVGHIELAAEETELTTVEVRERLAYFAPLFGLTLPAESAGDAESAPAPEVSAHAGP
ncbi:caspase family protein [Streptomyces sp. NPDC021224]|uniref:wHTH domain-containing protein n=1 Tax=unclassified Streptomyces TaxID=2593676 RepID=UPI00379DDCAF